MSGGLDRVLSELRERFVADALVRLDRIESAIGRLEETPGDTAALTELRRDFHGLSGTGTSYGYPDVTRVCRAVDVEAVGLLRSGSPPRGEQLSSWRRAAGEVREALLAPPAGPGGKEARKG